MLVKSKDYDAFRKTRSYFLSSIASSVVITFLIILFLIIFIAYQSQWYRRQTRINEAKVPLEAYWNFVQAINEESAIRVLDPAAGQAAEAIKKTESKFSAFLSSIKSHSSDEMGAISDRYAAYRSGSSSGIDMLNNQVGLINTARVPVFHFLVNSLFPLAHVTILRLLLLRAGQCFCSVASRMIYLEGSGPTGTRAMDAIPATAFRVVVGMAEQAQALLLEEQHVPPIFQSTLDSAAELLAGAYGFQSVSTTEHIESWPSLDPMKNFLAEHATVYEQTKTSRRVMIIAGVMLSMCMVALAILLFTVYLSGKIMLSSVLLVRSFEDEEHHQMLRSAYMPLLKDMRAVALPPVSKGEVEREYLIAGRLLETIRVTVPQVLFGPDFKKRELMPEIDDTWSILSEPLHLGQGNAILEGSIIMDIDLGGTLFVDQEGCDLTHELVRISTAYNIIVAEVNRAGGVVLGFRDGLRVAAVWNVTRRVTDAALTAVRVSWVLKDRLMTLPPRLAPLKLTICLVSGRSILANQRIGRRLYPYLHSSFLGFLYMLRLASSFTGARVLLDFAVYSRLPLATRHGCKPLISVQTQYKGGQRVVQVYSADFNSDMPVDQAVQYNACFTLFASNMLVEAASAYTKYCAMYPEDVDAAWVLTHIIHFRLAIGGNEGTESIPEAAG